MLEKKGDLSENGAYKYAKFELGNVRRELKKINHLLRWGVVTKAKNNLIADFGSSVSLKNDKMEVTYMLVSEHESNPMEKKLSVKSPLGKSIVGKSVGEIVTFQAPAGEVRYEVVKIA
jgi:transcription elongation factor GreA